MQCGLSHPIRGAVSIAELGSGHEIEVGRRLLQADAENAPDGITYARTGAGTGAAAGRKRPSGKT